MGKQGIPSTVLTRLVQMNVRPGRPVENTATILDHVRRASADGIELLVFPEMAVPGYLIGDEWEHEAFLRECERCGNEIREAADKITVVFGNVGLDWARRNEDGRVRKYNALFVAEDRTYKGPAGTPYQFVVKTLMPNYREFDDSRHFYDLRKLALESGKTLADLAAPVETRVGRLGCFLCEDAWDTDYAQSPLDLLSRHPVDLYVNISASPFTFHKNHKRQRVYSAQATRLGRPLLYVNHTGIQNNGKTVFTFDGRSCIYDAHGHCVSTARPFESSELTLRVPLDKTASFGAEVNLQRDTVVDLYTAVEYGTREFLQLCGAKRVTIGVSGGIDSAVVAAIYRRILEPRDVLLVNMPGSFTSQTTRNLAAELAANLGCLYTEIAIPDSVSLTRKQVDGLAVTSPDGRLKETLKVSGLVLENIQARDRSSRILAAVSAAFGSVFTCNANKAEATVGYTTLYGDLCGYLANIADLWKMEVYELGRHLNQAVYGRKVIPDGIFDVTPSAELSPAQNVDEKKGDPLIYPYHDRLFAAWVERWNRATPEEIIGWYAEGTLEKNLEYAGRVSDLFPTTAAFVADLERWWNQYQGMGLAKRIQAPPVLAVKKRAFGFDHRESQMGPHYTREYQEIKKKVLGKPAGS